MFIIAGVEPAPEVGRGLFESDGSRIFRSLSFLPCRLVISGRVKASCRPNHQTWHDLFGKPVSTFPEKAIEPYMFIHGEASMTAYLISLALAGLVAIAVWEGLA